jgi:hypothetical protein
MPVPLSGIPSASDRTLYTRRGPIVKRPLPLLSGSNLTVVSNDEVLIPTGSFGPSTVGMTVTISGSPGGRNDGTFQVAAALNSVRLRLSGVNLDYCDAQSTTALLVALANGLKASLNAHVATFDVTPAVHGQQDLSDQVAFEDCVDLDSAIILLNLIRTAFNAHIPKVGPAPSVHSFPDDQNASLFPQASNLASAVLLANELRRQYEAHRQTLGFHEVRDVENRVTEPPVEIVKGGPAAGPFNWVLSDPRYGQIADDPSDVAVRVDGSPVPVDAVFGLLGAIVLASRPPSGSSVVVDYSWLDNPPVQIARLSSPEFSFNQAGEKGLSGFPHHRYKVRSTLIDPANPRLVRSPSMPARTGWKYKGLERRYTAALNDPNLLLTNVPNNRITYPVLSATARETVVRYDPVALPDASTDPWTLEGSGGASLAPGGTELLVSDPSVQSGPGEVPPFYSHKVDFTFPSTVSSAFRVRVVEAVADGSFTGVGFGVSDGSRTALAGFLETRANNLSSAVALANQVKARYASHLVLTGTHRPDDPSSAVDVVDAKDLTSLKILVNRMKALYNAHVAKGSGTVHVVSDSANQVLAPDAVDLATAVSLVNEIASKYDLHRVQPGIHYVDDVLNATALVRQVGILTSRGYPEDPASWDSSAYDWSVMTTYRLYKDLDGNYSLFVGGSVTPQARTAGSDLPETSDLDVKADAAQRVFFGAVWRGATSTSGWALVRTTVAPADFSQSADNKSVDYGADVVPEADVAAPWVTVGQGGSERVLPGLSPRLLLDSVASVPQSVSPGLGMATGEYRGFLRSEPILSSRNTSAVEFLASLSYWTFSVDNRSAGVFVDDGLFSVHMAFLQHTPSPATVSGTSSQPFSISGGDTAILSVGSGQPVSVVFGSPVTTAAGAASVLNAAVGFPIAADDGSGKVVLTDQSSGASSKIALLGGVAFEKLGLALGTYFGRDSNPEPKVSWYGAALPDQDEIAWSPAGSQAAAMFGRVMRVTDSSASDFRSYLLEDLLYTAPVFGPGSDWKVDARFAVVEFSAGDVVASGSNLRFAGAMVVMDEGPSGKSVEVHAAVDSLGGAWLNVLSYNPSTGSLDQQASFPFAWDDGLPHTLNVFTSKGAGICVVVADGVALGTFSYGSLNQGFSGPSITFGSGGSPVANCDLGSALSTVDWSSVSAFRDSKVSDPSSASRRYIGIYAGGDPSVLSSYYLHQIDWTVPHTYRVVRDPVSSVAVYVDGSSVPSISVSYDSLTLPPSASSFLAGLTDSRQVVAFGSLNSSEISRTVWGPVRYSVGKMTITERRVPPHQVLNQANAFSSPDHLFTKAPHRHAGFRVYSGGTPLDEFMYDQSVPSFTVLGEGTPPVPMTQDLESRGGLSRTAMLASAATALGFVNTRGYLTDLTDDVYNGVLVPSAEASLIAAARACVLALNAHFMSPGVHPSDDLVNTLSLPPITTVADAVSAINAVAAAYAAHRVEPGVHIVDDVYSVVTAAPATGAETFVALAQDFGLRLNEHALRVWPHVVDDLGNAVLSPDAFDVPSTVTLIIELNSRYAGHRTSPGVHVADDISNVVVSDPDLLVVLNRLKAAFNAHQGFYVPAGSHKGPDRFNEVTSADATDLASAIALSNELKAKLNAHLVQKDAHSEVDADASSFVPSPDGGSTAISAASVLEESLAFEAALKASLNRHVVQRMVHVSDDEKNDAAVPDPVDLPSGLAAAALMKLRFNSHRTSVSDDSGSRTHVADDAVNVVTDADPSNLSELVSFLEALRTAFNAHYVQPGVHGSSVFIKLDPPPRVRYQGTRFYRTDSGSPGLLGAGSDGGGPSSPSPLSLKSVHTLSYEGGSLPEFVNLVGSAVEPFAPLLGDSVTIQIGEDSYSAMLQPGDTTAALAAARINTAPGIPPGTASDNGDGRVRITAPSAGVPVRASGPGASRLGLDTAQSASWFLISDDPSAVSVTLMTSGPTDFLRYGTVGGGTRTVYAARTGLTDAPSLDYRASFRIRVNSAAVGPDGDSGVYVGVSGAGGPGYTVGIGFDYVAGVRYVKVRDLNSGSDIFRRAFDWTDGAFHTYTIWKDTVSDSLGLSVA